jgi:hypothetical protein
MRRSCLTLLAVTAIVLAAVTSLGACRAAPASASTPPGVVFGTNMPLFDGNEQMLSNAGTRAIFAGWRTPVIRMPSRASLSDAVELQALNVIKSIGATPLMIVHGAVDANVLADDLHLLGLAAQVFGSGTVYAEYGNEEDGGAHISDVTYTSSWNATVPALKAAHPTYRFMGPVNYHSDPAYIGYFVGHANPVPDVVSWHEYTCQPSAATATCRSNIGNWAAHAADTNRAEIAAAGHTVPFMISEWNMDPSPDSRYLDPSVIGPWTTAALRELASLTASGLVGAQQYCADVQGGGFALVDSSNHLTPQGQAFQAAMGAPPSPGARRGGPR